MGLSGRTPLLYQVGQGKESGAKARGLFPVSAGPQLDGQGCPVATQPTGELVHSQQ